MMRDRAHQQAKRKVKLKLFLTAKLPPHTQYQPKGGCRNVTNQLEAEASKQANQKLNEENYYTLMKWDR